MRKGYLISHKFIFRKIGGDMCTCYGKVLENIGISPFFEDN